MADPPIREVGRLDDVEGQRVIVGVDCDAVTIRSDLTVRFDAAGRDLFIRYWMLADGLAEDWATAHGGSDR